MVTRRARDGGGRGDGVCGGKLGAPLLPVVFLKVGGPPSLRKPGALPAPLAKASTGGGMPPQVGREPVRRPPVVRELSAPPPMAAARGRRGGAVAAALSRRCCGGDGAAAAAALVRGLDASPSVRTACGRVWELGMGEASPVPGLGQPAEGGSEGEREEAACW